MNLKTIIKNNRVFFHALKSGVATYKVQTEGEWFIFPVALADVGNGTLLVEDKAIYFMRYIRKALNDNTFFNLEQRPNYVFSA